MDANQVLRLRRLKKLIKSWKIFLVMPEPSLQKRFSNKSIQNRNLFEFDGKKLVRSLILEYVLSSPLIESEERLLMSETPWLWHAMLQR